VTCGGRRVGRVAVERRSGRHRLLAIATLFVLELLNSRRLGAGAPARALAFAAVHGTPVVFAVESGAALRADPEIAFEAYEGVTVLAAALVVSALAYVGYLSVVDRSA